MIRALAFLVLIFLVLIFPPRQAAVMRDGKAGSLRQAQGRLSLGVPPDSE
jgi:hypothetical protein